MMHGQRNTKKEPLNILFEVHLVKKMRNRKNRRRKGERNTRIHSKINEKWKKAKRK
jgi:hypothetical protein